MRPALFAALLVALAGCVSPPEAEPEPVEAPDRAPAETRPTPVAPSATVPALAPVPAPTAPFDVVLLPTGHDGAEPSLGVTSDGTIFLTSWDKLLRSADGGTTWEVLRHFLPQDDDALKALRRGGALRVEDPMLWVDPVTDRVFSAPMFPILACKHLAWSDDRGDTWTERPAECHPPPYDHQKVASGVPGPKAPAFAGVAYPTVVYDCWHAIWAQLCAVSYDGGLTWAVHTVASDAVRGDQEREAVDACTQNGRPAVSAEGVVALPLSKACATPLVAFSEDSGLTWTLSAAPVDGGTEDDDHAAAFDAHGTLYLAYPDGESVLHLVRTNDLGATWEGPFRVAAPDVGVTLFQALVADGAGRLGAAYLGTGEASGTPEDVAEDARWHLYVATSDDGGATWRTVRATPDHDPVQVGAYCMQGAECLGGARNLADFIDARKAPDGALLVAFADGCVDCQDAASSRRALTTLARVEGWGEATPP